MHSCMKLAVLRQMITIKLLIQHVSVARYQHTMPSSTMTIKIFAFRIKLRHQSRARVVYGQ